MDISGKRIKREEETVGMMIRLYCRKNHAGKVLCLRCQALLEYSSSRLSRCIFQSNKPTCASCPVHCYKPAMREQIRQVMRFSGPRMLLYHPLAAIRHLIDNLSSRSLKNKP